MKRILLILLAAGLWHSPVSAEVYYWRAVGYNTNYPSAVAACDGAVGRQSGNNNRVVSVVLQTTTEGVCNWFSGSFGDRTFNLQRYGDSCPSDTEYNSATGECAAPPGNPGEACEKEGEALTGFGFIQNSEGQCVDFARADNSSQCKSLGGKSGFTDIYVTFDDDGNPQNPPKTTVQGCATTVATTAHCTKAPARKFETGGSIQYSVNKCRVAVSFTGETAGPGPLAVSTGPEDEGVCDPATDCPDPQPGPIENESKPCVYTEDGEGRRVCDSSSFNYKPGESSCGTVNGEFKCVGKAPTANGVDISTTITEKNNPDGSKTVTKKDVATTTQCIGAYSCTSQTTTNTTTTVKDGAGNTVSESGSCTGPACSDKGQGGMDSCALGAECSEEEEEFSGPENEDAAGFGESTQSFVDRVSGAPIIAAARGLTFSGGGSCSFGSFSVPILGTLSFQPMCAWAADWFAPLRALMLCLWGLVAVRTFFEA